MAKIKRNKKTDKPDKRKHTKPKGGRPNLEDQELTPEMLAFADYIGHGNTPEMAGQILGLSDYKVKTYSELESVKKEIQKYRNIYQISDEKERWLKELEEVVRFHHLS